MKVTIFGIGYVGLVQAAALADVGHDVICVDVDSDKIARLNRGDIPIFEPGLTRLVQENHEAGRLHFTTDAARGVGHGRIQFIAVGTPPDEDGSADLKHVLAVAGTIAAHMDDAKIVVTKSTVPVGTADRVRAAIETVLAARGRSDLGFDVASNPEFLKEGSAVADFMKPDRIILGTDNDETEQLIRELYAPFSRNHDKIIIMDARSAEFTKYAANCMLATKISFMNEMANLAERLGADIEEVRRGIGSDPRIGYHFIYPGIGYGGSCFPKDVQALIHLAESTGFEPTVLKSVEARNKTQKTVLFDKVRKHFGDDLHGKTFALWGLAFKPNTNDMREAPSRAIMEALWAAGARVRAFDPEAMDECARLYSGRDDLALVDSPEAALDGADALIIATEWKQFHAPDFERIKSQLAAPVIFDGRNLYNPDTMQRYGIRYYGIGRADSGTGNSS
ncbi:MAG: UDP-glucose/GDP-mannose dehydrogenase family protein [Alphaproteobacteria bacterium]|nr:UDP-glucose/GDP-mannose dehydrogenase family protein [Alphaproteobacteria bacterium]